MCNDKDSVRHFKQMNKLGRFAPQAEVNHTEFQEEAQNITVGQRCMYADSVATMEKRGVVAFVGQTSFKPGFWVGINLDEPVGKHSGTVDEVEYFKCPNKHGVMVRPNLVQVGDFPPEDLFDEF